MYKNDIQSLRYDPKTKTEETSPQTKLDNLKEHCSSKVKLISEPNNFFNFSH